MLKRIVILTRFENFWHKEKRIATINIMDVCNRKVSKFSQKIVGSVFAMPMILSKFTQKLFLLTHLVG